MTKPFLIRHADGREYELAGDKAGKDRYRDDYQPQGFRVVDPQPHTHERPDLSEPKPKKAKADDDAAEHERPAVPAGGTGSVPGPDVHAADADAGGK